MPVLTVSPIPFFVPASLATEPVGDTFAGSIVPGDSSTPEVGYLLVSLMGGPDHASRWFFVEAAYNGATAYGHAIADCQRARRADPNGPYRRLVPVRADGTAS